jgi:phosphoesterase RecJ-like protein
MMEQAIKLLQDADKVLVACHRRPDADALGSALGFAFIARSLGKEVSVFVPDALPPNLRFLACGDIQREVPDTSFDVTFVMDTAATMLLPAGLPDKAQRGPLVIIDHHAAHDDVGDVVVRDIDACATAEVIMDMAEILGVRPVPAQAATPLYAALVADTGGFRYPSTRARVLRMAAELVDGGADPWHVAYELFEGWQPSRLRLLGAVLDSLEVSLDGRLALMFVTRKMLDDCDADDDMVEGMVNYGRMLRGVEVAALVWEFETEDGLETKVSLRSRGEADVSAIATQLGGGGHRSAAGSQVATSLEATAEKLRQLVDALLG